MSNNIISNERKRIRDNRTNSKQTKQNTQIKKSSMTTINKSKPDAKKDKLQRSKRSQLWDIIKDTGRGSTKDGTEAIKNQQTS